MIKFYDLSPVNDITLDIYKEAISYSLKNNNIKNIAISGSYGAGKSSVLESYKNQEKDKKFLHISLTYFKELDDKEDKNQILNINTLESKILNQLIHQISVDKIPQTCFKVKRKTLFYNIYFYKWKSFILKDLPCLILSTTNIFRFSSFIGLSFLLGIFIYKALKVQKTKNVFKKLNLNGNEIEIAEDSNESFFDKYLNEVLYLFEEANVDVIVFEDIDRYGMGEIFGRLREINTLVNNRLKPEGKILKFLYLLKDDTFTSKDRTKFFDFIIPIIPVIDSSNSYNKILELFGKEYSEKLDKYFLQDISLYIDDMRLLKNVYNEFKIYYERLKIIEINCNKMLGIIIYKNLFPKDFSELQLNQGFVYNLFVKKDEFINNEIINLNKEINQFKEKIESIRSEHLIRIEELDFIKNNLNSLKINNRREWMDNYIVRKETIDSYKESRISKLQNQISEIEKFKNTLLNKSLKEIITSKNINTIFEIEVKNELNNIKKFDDVKTNTYFKLLKYLIRSGYLDNTYSDYMTYFYENSLSKEDKIFLRCVLDREKKEYNYNLKNPGLVLERLKENDFEEIESLNFNLLENLLENDKEKNKLVILLTQLKKTKNFDFIRKFFNLDIKSKLLVKNLNSIWKEFFKELIEEKEFSKEEEHYYSILTLYTSDKNLLNDINISNILKEYVEMKEDYLEIENPNINKLIEKFNELDIKFKKINYSLANKELFNEIYKNSMYELNFYNISLMLKEILRITSNDEISKKNYTCIYNNSSSELYNYVEDNINSYIEIILENCNSIIEDDEPVALKLLNNENIDEENKIKYIEFLRTIISSITSIEYIHLWDKLLQNGKILYSEENIILYFNEKQKLSDTLINFINLEKKPLSFENIKNIISEEIVEKFFDYILICNSLKNSIYKNIIGSFKWHYESGNFPENISKEKMNILIKLKIIRMTSKNLEKIRENYKDNLNYFITYNIDLYSETVSESLFSQEELLMILSNSDIEEKVKLELLKLSKNPIYITNMDYSSNIQEYILKNNYDKKEFKNLIKEYNQYDSSIKNIIFELAIPNINNDYYILLAASPELRKRIFSSNEISNEKKLDFLIASLEEMNEKKEVLKYLKFMNLKEYNDIFKKDLTLIIAKTAFNEKLLQKLQEKEFIDNFNEKEEFYEVLTKKRYIEKFID
ncbi:hypothetical protein [Fusobacterium sp.]|uniref:YobI family P-loop NTPase n=1 Tax=Fusobacterium sp. TaxID=68766 RepID=UPI0029051230|nr:hypothetical protein [Fusobacterium sp.]MDU1912591.1 hypothetical protein [Fusobacterium sp.]